MAPYILSELKNTARPAQIKTNHPNLWHVKSILVCFIFGYNPTDQSGWSCSKFNEGRIKVASILFLLLKIRKLCPFVYEAFGLHDFDVCRKTFCWIGEFQYWISIFNIPCTSLRLFVQNTYLELVLQNTVLTKSALPVSCLWSRGHLNVLIGTKLILDDQGDQSYSFKINLVSYKQETGRSLFCKHGIQKRL